MDNCSDWTDRVVTNWIIPTLACSFVFVNPTHVLEPGTQDHFQSCQFYIWKHICCRFLFQLGRTQKPFLIGFTDAWWDSLSCPALAASRPCRLPVPHFIVLSLLPKWTLCTWTLVSGSLWVPNKHRWETFFVKVLEKLFIFYFYMRAHSQLFWNKNNLDKRSLPYL